jgi:hypothetical protein
MICAHDLGVGRNIYPKLWVCVELNRQANGNGEEPTMTDIELPSEEI